MLDVIAQIAIFLFGTGAVFLSQTRQPGTRKWAPVLGLLGQPAWFYTTYQAQQWGIFAVSWIYLASWAYGFYNQWIVPPGGYLYPSKKD